MAYACKILADSLSPCGDRLTTFEVTFPRMVLAEFNTHRVFSRNSASSRAIPVEKQIKKVLEDPFIPIYWGKNQKGMTADQEITEEEQEEARTQWLYMRDDAVTYAERLVRLGIHKQITNRLLEPFMWHTVIVTATEWENFFNLRCHKDAQPEIRCIAELMKTAYVFGTPEPIAYGQWHLPLVTKDEFHSTIGSCGPDAEEYLRLYWVKVSAGRCARVSYLTHDGVRDPDADIELCNRLMASGHMSPLEHPATPGIGSAEHSVFIGNFRGWTQYRKTIPGENVYHADV